MGLFINIAIAIPTGIIIYLLIDKIINKLTMENNFNEKVQKKFVIDFICGIGLIILALTVFADGGVFDNQSLQIAVSGVATCLIISTVMINWYYIDDGGKIIILGLAVIALIICAYTQPRYKNKIK